MHLEPKTEEEGELVQMLFEEVTNTWPDLPMGDRTDFAMRAFAVVKKWATRNEDVKTIVNPDKEDATINLSEEKHKS